MDLPRPDGQGLQLQAVPHLPLGLLPAPPGLVDVRQLPDREDALVVVLPHQFGRHPVQQAQVVLLFRLLEAGVPEWAARAVLVQHDRRGVASWLARPCPQRLDDPPHLLVLAGQLHLAGAVAEQNQRARGRLPALHFAKDEALVGQPKGVWPRGPAGADYFHRLVAESPQPRGFVHLRQEVATCMESFACKFRVGDHLHAGYSNRRTH